MNKHNPVKLKCHLGTGDVWVEATSTHLAFYELEPAPEREEKLRLFIPLSTSIENERVIGALLDLAEFLENKLEATPEVPLGPVTC